MDNLIVRNEKGQTTVELAVLMPALLAAAIIVVNALSFMQTCAVFDRQARHAFAVLGTTSALGHGAGDATAQALSDIEQAVKAPNVEVQVQASGSVLGLTTYTAQLQYAPTLFGMGLRSEIFGVALPKLTHEISLSVDCYKPGVFF